MLVSESWRHVDLSRFWDDWIKRISEADERRSLFALFATHYPRFIDSNEVRQWYKEGFEGTLLAGSRVASLGLQVVGLVSMLEAAGLGSLARDMERVHSLHAFRLDEMRKNPAGPGAPVVPPAAPRRSLLDTLIDPRLASYWDRWFALLSAAGAIRLRGLYREFQYFYPRDIGADKVDLWLHQKSARGAVTAVAALGLPLEKFLAVLDLSAYSALAREIRAALSTPKAAAAPAPAPAPAPVEASSDYDSKTCIVCFERARNTAFAPCGHLGFCWQCVSALKRCPQCRAEGNPLKLFVS